MNALARFFHGDQAAARAELFARGFLLLLALDAWLLMITAAGRFGLGGFNVAHFGWLDALLPAPSAELAVALLVALGLLAFALGQALAAAVLLVAVGSGLGLPGALAGCAVAAAALVAAVAVALRGPAVRDPRPWLRAVALAALALWLAIAASPARWDFYRECAGDLVSLGELRAALDAYREAERHAPAGETRAAEIAELERRLGP